MLCLYYYFSTHSHRGKAWNNAAQADGAPDVQDTQDVHPWTDRECEHEMPNDDAQCVGPSDMQSTKDDRNTQDARTTGPSGAQDIGHIR